MPKETPEERTARIVRQHQEVMEKAIAFTVPSTVGKAVIELVQAGEGLTRASLLARLERVAEWGNAADQAAAKAAVALIEELPAEDRSPP